MTDATQESAPNEKLSTYLYFCSLYFIAMGVLYLWGYWSTFNVNILEYLSLADIVKSTAYPIASTVVFFAMGAVMGEFFGLGKTLPPGGGRNTSVGKFLNKTRSFVVATYGVVTLAILQFGPVEKWFVLPVLVAIPVAVACKEGGFFRSIIPNDSLRSIVLFLLAAIPIYTYGQGRIGADQILNGARFQYVVSPIDNVSVDNQVDPSRRPRYLGHTGEFLFFFEPTKGALIIGKFEDTKTLVLKQFERARSVSAGSSAPFVAGSGTDKPASAPHLKP